MRALTGASTPVVRGMAYRTLAISNASLETFGRGVKHWGWQPGGCRHSRLVRQTAAKARACVCVCVWGRWGRGVAHPLLFRPEAVGAAAGVRTTRALLCALRAGVEAVQRARQVAEARQREGQRLVSPAGAGGARRARATWRACGELEQWEPSERSQQAGRAALTAENPIYTTPPASNGKGMSHP